MAMCACFVNLNASVLSTTAAGMQPGTWAQIAASNQNPALGVGSISGTMIHFCNSMPWNPVSKVIEIIGQDHSYPALRHVRYDEATNQFILVADNAGLGSGHGYDHNSLNPFTGDLYNRLYSGFSGSLSFKKKAYGTSSFVSIPSVPASDQVAIGTCWWSGSFIGGGSQGSFMVFNSGNATGTAKDGQIAAYNPLTNTWFYNQEGRAPNYGGGSTYHSLMEYSAKKNVAVYGGGNVAPNKLWRMSSDGSVLAMPDVPAGKAVGIQRGLLTDDPATGNFLLLSAGQLWELNPDGAGTWTQQTGARVPPSGVGIPGPDPTITAVICTSIPDYGVVAYITQPNQNNGTMFIYKHASNSAATIAEKTHAEMAGLSVQPVPASVSGILRISPVGPAAHYAVYDVGGKMIADLGGKTAWVPRGIKPGVYIVKAQMGGRTLCRKLILE